MKHLSDDEILEYLKGETGPETAGTIRRHLEECEACRAALAALEGTAAWLERWPDEVIPDELLERTRSALIALKPDAFPDRSADARTRFRYRPWPARLATALAAVAAVVLIQVFVWNPFGGSVLVQGLLALMPPALAMPAGQAVPDTVLVITLHPGGTLSTPHTEGPVSLEELMSVLMDRIAPGTYRAILLVGSDPEHPISIRLDRFEELKEALGITALQVGSGVVGVSSFFWSYVHPAWSLRSTPRAPTWTRSDSLRWPLFAPGIPFPGTELTSLWSALQWQEVRGGGGTGHWIYTPGEGGAWPLFIRPGGRWTVLHRRSDSDPDSVTSGTDASVYEALTEGNGVVAAITEEGRIVLSRSVTDTPLITQQFQLLQSFIPDLSLKILAPEGRLRQAQELEVTARRLGIESIEIVRLKKK